MEHCDMNEYINMSKDVKVNVNKKHGVRGKVKVSEGEKFTNWFNNEYLFSRDIDAPIIQSGNNISMCRFRRIGKVARMLIDNPNRELQSIREEISATFFIGRRTSLDYINEAKSIIKLYMKGLNI